MPFSFTLYWSKNIFTPNIFSIRGLTTFTKSYDAENDVNNLKTANDQYSHEVGDKLICCSAKAISDAFDGKCFCGRYGGDEFIACIKKSGNIQAEIEERLDNFRKNICVLNNQGDFPFEISIAYGYASSCGNSGKKPEEIVSQADREMYVQKTKMKNFV